MKMQQPHQSALFVFMGLPASGKSTLAGTWAKSHQFSYFNADTVRKQLVGVSDSAHQEVTWAQGYYIPQMTRRTYDALLTSAGQELAAGRTVVLNACYGAREERVRLRQFANNSNTTLHFVLCYCSTEATRNRLAERAIPNTAESDTEWRIFKAQQETLDPLADLEPTMVVSINTEYPQEQLLDQLDFAFEKKPPITVIAP